MSSVFAVLALTLAIAWVGVVAGFRTYLQHRATGDVPALNLGARGRAQRWARIISTVAFALVIAAPVAELLGLRAIPFVDHTAVRVVGVVLVVLGIIATLHAQLAMGASWRGDVDPELRTDLVTTGPFRFVRNPIFTATAATEIGLALMVPNVLALAMLVAVFVALQIQVRLVEEPYLLRVHGDAYRRYAARTGRFLPGIGRLKP